MKLELLSRHSDWEIQYSKPPLPFLGLIPLARYKYLEANLPISPQLRGQAKSLESYITAAGLGLDFSWKTTCDAIRQKHVLSGLKYGETYPNMRVKRSNMNTILDIAYIMKHTTRLSLLEIPPSLNYPNE